MCTRLFIPIKSVAVRGLKYSFVPCGKCYDCQVLQRNEWGTRLRLQIDSMPNKENYWAAFCTLTFSDLTIPRMPRVLYRDPRKYTDRNLCFDKSVGQRFCRSFRDHLRKVYKHVKPIYLFCSEFGETTARPHHHFFVFYPRLLTRRKFLAILTENGASMGLCSHVILTAGPMKMAIITSLFWSRTSIRLLATSVSMLQSRLPSTNNLMKRSFGMNRKIKKFVLRIIVPIISRPEVWRKIGSLLRRMIGK